MEIVDNQPTYRMAPRSLLSSLHLRVLPNKDIQSSHKQKPFSASFRSGFAPRFVTRSISPLLSFPAEKTTSNKTTSNSGEDLQSNQSMKYR
jgi:hypothetical protein